MTVESNTVTTTADKSIIRPAIPKSLLVIEEKKLILREPFEIARIFQNLPVEGQQQLITQSVTELATLLVNGKINEGKFSGTMQEIHRHAGRNDSEQGGIAVRQLSTDQRFSDVDILRVLSDFLPVDFSWHQLNMFDLEVCSTDKMVAYVKDFIERKPTFVKDVNKEEEDGKFADEELEVLSDSVREEYIAYSLDNNAESERPTKFQEEHLSKLLAIIVQRDSEQLDGCDEEGCFLEAVFTRLATKDRRGRPTVSAFLFDSINYLRKKGDESAITVFQQLRSLGIQKER